MTPLLFQSVFETFQTVAMVIGFIAVILTALGGLISFIWWTIWGRKDAEQVKLSQIQDRRIAHLEKELSDMNLELIEVKNENKDLRREVEKLKKANLRLQGLIEHDE